MSGPRSRKLVTFKTDKSNSILPTLRCCGIACRPLQIELRNTTFRQRKPARMNRNGWASLTFPKRRRVLFVTGEASEAAAIRKVKRATESRNLRREDFTDSLRIEAISLPTLPSLDDCQAVAAAVKAHEIEVVLLDPLFMGLQGLNTANLTEFGPESRLVPLFAELTCILSEGFEAAEDGSTLVITRYRDSTQNLQLHNEHFDRASTEVTHPTIKSEVLAPHACETTETGRPTQAKQRTPKNSMFYGVLRMTLHPCGNVGWALRGSNPRPPRCKRGALTN